MDYFSIRYSSSYFPTKKKVSRQALSHVVRLSTIIVYKLADSILSKKLNDRKRCINFQAVRE